MSVYDISVAECDLVLTVLHEQSRGWDMKLGLAIREYE